MGLANKIVGAVKDFEARWSITDQKSYDEEFSRFKTRIKNCLGQIDQRITEDGIRSFCQVLGISEEWFDDQFIRGPKWTLVVTRHLEEARSELEYYKVLQIVLMLPMVGQSGYGGRTIFNKEMLLEEIKEAVDISNVKVGMCFDAGGEPILYPRGEKFLDRELVEHALSCLRGEASEHFKQALTLFSKNTNSDRIQSAEQLRRTIEEHLRALLDNDKGLKANIQVLLTTLKGRNVSTEVRNLIRNDLAYLDQFWNENSKHQNGDISETDGEMLIYRTAMLTRFIERSLRDEHITRD